jgi:hypothetical protein
MRAGQISRQESHQQLKLCDFQRLKLLLPGVAHRSASFGRQVKRKSTEMVKSVGHAAPFLTDAVQIVTTEAVDFQHRLWECWTCFTFPRDATRGGRAFSFDSALPP